MNAVSATSASPATGAMTKTTSYHAGGLMETNDAGALTVFEVDGPAGDLARYTAAPTSGQTAVSFAYYDAHGDLVAETTTSPTGKTSYSYDPFGALLQATPANSARYLFSASRASSPSLSSCWPPVV